MYEFVRSARIYKIELEVGSTTSRGSGGSAPGSGVSKGAAPLWRGLGATPQTQFLEGDYGKTNETR